jgi:hypothetical protein
MFFGQGKVKENGCSEHPQRAIPDFNFRFPQQHFKR